ncbi:MAG: hypothetical protein KAW61_10405, partial [candidate division Zixibacteria bacterium]|nr:hypothetical protein [candidate division Zixibacteria bacterium]
MKRISLMLALFLTLSFGMAFAQGNGSQINLDSVDGLVEGKIPCNIGSDVTFHLGYLNGDDVNKGKGLTNGYELHATGGAHWTISYTREFTFDPALHFNLVNKWNKFSWDGLDYDTLAYSGVIGGYDPEEDPPGTADGLPPGYDGPAIGITVNFGINPGYDGETFCIDSCWFPTSGTWMWAYGSEIGSFPPDWQGPHCFDLYNVPDLNVEWTVVNPSYTGDHCVPVVLNYTVIDPDTPDEDDDPPATFQATGPGAVASTGDWTCQYTYAPTLGDVGATIVVTLGAHD